MPSYYDDPREALQMDRRFEEQRVRAYEDLRRRAEEDRRAREVPIFDRGYSSLGITPRGGNVDIRKGHHTVYGRGPDGVDYRVSWNVHQDSSTSARHINEQLFGKE